MGSLMGRDFLKIEGLSQDEIYHLISKSLEFKRSPLKWGMRLKGRSVALIFHKPSMRTRISFEAAAVSLGAHPIFLREDEIGLGEREPIADVGRVLSRYVEAIIIRTFAQRIAEEMAESSSVPVINALTDEEHPCQAIADLVTIVEKKGRLAGLKLAFVGDGANNVARSLLMAAATTRMKIAIASPSGYEPEPAVIERARSLSGSVDQMIEVFDDPAQAVDKADVVYTDVWISMGQEKERESKVRAFAGFQVNSELLSRAKDGAIVMHCLPAHRDEEISDEVLEAQAGVIFDQAENRLHTAKAILSAVVGE